MNVIQYFLFFRGEGCGPITSAVRAIRIRHLGHRVYMRPRRWGRRGPADRLIWKKMKRQAIERERKFS